MFEAYSEVRKIFLKNHYVLSAIKKIVAILTSVAITSLISRYLGPSAKGEYSYFQSILHIVVIVSQFGFFKLYSQDKRRGMENVSSVYFTFIILKAAVLFVISIFAVFVMRQLGAPQYLLLLPFMTVVFTLSGELTFLLLIDCFETNVYISLLVQIINLILLVIVYFFIQSL